MVNNISPTYLSSLVTSTVRNTTTYQLRNAADLHTMRANSQLHNNSFLPSDIRDWNELPDNVRNSPSKMAFKRHLNNNITNPPNFFFAWDRSITHGSKTKNDGHSTHIHTPTINVLLYGSQELNELQNEQIFTAV